MNFVSADDPAAAPLAGTSTREVVLIEDSPDYARAVMTMLDHSPGNAVYTIRYFAQLADALDYVPGSDVCCILLDLNLPDSRGVEAVNTLQEVAPQIPIVVLTGQDDDQLALDAMH